VKADDKALRADIRKVESLWREIIACRVGEYEKAIGLDGPHQGFREAVTKAICACLFQHALKTPSKGQIQKQRRNDLLRASRAARTACGSLRDLDTALNSLPEGIVQCLEQHWGLSGQIAYRSIESTTAWLQTARSYLDLYAKELANRNKGGRPEPLLAFRVLAAGLAKAIKVATGRAAKVNWSIPDDRWRESKFLDLVEAVWPLVEKMADPSGRRPMQRPKPSALAPYLHRLTSPGIRKTRGQRQRPRR
jgi:hypothetical protein